MKGTPPLLEVLWIKTEFGLNPMLQKSCSSHRLVFNSSIRYFTPDLRQQVSHKILEVLLKSNKTLLQCIRLQATNPLKKKTSICIYHSPGLLHEKMQLFLEPATPTLRKSCTISEAESYLLANLCYSHRFIQAILD